MKQEPTSDAPAEGHYGFQAHLTSEFPSQIVVDVTERCNLACRHCPHEDLRKEGKLNNAVLPPDLHEKLISEVAHCARGHCRYLRYTAQGEPLLHPQLFDFLEDAKTRAGVPLNITTNGTLLDGPRAERLLQIGVDVVDVSIDAHTPETYRAIRRNAELAVTQEHVLNMIRRRRELLSATRVVVSFVEQPENREEAAAFEKFWKEAGADFVVVRRLHSSAGAKGPAPCSNIPRYPCLYPWERLSLAPDGSLLYCPQDWVHGSRIADFHATTIRECWQSRAMDAVRHAHAHLDFAACPFCAACGDWAMTRWPRHGRSYSDMMRAFSGKHVEAT